jgi:hypothetical protein
MFELTRRRLFQLFLVGIGLSSVGVGAGVYENRAQFKDANRAQIKDAISGKILKNKIKSGYVVKLDGAGNVVAPGWSVNPGDKIGLALNSVSPERVSGSITFTDSAGRPAFELDGFEFGRQEFSSKEPWLDGAGFSVSGSGHVPLDLQSGVYFAANDPTLFIVVKRPEQDPANKKKKIVVLISTNTFNAYSATDGRSLYSPYRVPAVSFYRPQSGVKRKEWRPFLSWVVSDQPFGPDVQFSYITDFEMDEPLWLEGADLLVVLGHSEYWTRKAREVFDAFVERGGHALVASGNTMWWQVRYEGDAQSVLVSYKSRSEQDPMAETEDETTNWIKPILNYPVIPSIGGGFKEGGFGIFNRPTQAKGWGGYMIIDGSHPLLRGTGLRAGDCFPFFKWMEYDGAPILGFDSSGMPVADLEQIGASKFELLGFDLGYNEGHTVGTMHVMQRTPKSGYLFNIGAKDFARTWAKSKREPWHQSSQVMKRLFQNFVSDVFSGASPFSQNPPQEQVVYSMTTPWKHDLPAGLPWLSSPPACQPKTHPN